MNSFQKFYKIQFWVSCRVWSIKDPNRPKIKLLYKITFTSYFVSLRYKYFLCHFHRNNTEYFTLFQNPIHTEAQVDKYIFLFSASGNFFLETNPNPPFAMISDNDARPQTELDVIVEVDEWTREEHQVDLQEFFNIKFHQISTYTDTSTTLY